MNQYDQQAYDEYGDEYYPEHPDPFVIQNME
jgi:hypothetical protein